MCIRDSRRYSTGPVLDIFFPFRGATATTDPVMQALSQVRCAGATAGGSSRTQIRIIYAIATRPVLQILRNGSGRGAIPMKQSVITNGRREIVKYNHSKWMT